ncbi:hypothetical protein ACROYT_G036154 [Oculina patagonica]
MFTGKQSRYPKCNLVPRVPLLETRLGQGKAINVILLLPSQPRITSAFRTTVAKERYIKSETNKTDQLRRVMMASPFML